MKVLTDYITVEMPANVGSTQMKTISVPAVVHATGCPFELALDGSSTPDQPSIVEVPDEYEDQIRALGYVVL